MEYQDGVQIRWLGAAGLEFSWRGIRVLIDPFFTRPPVWKNLFFRVNPDRELIGSHIRRADGLLITHAHYDHTMDAASIQQQTGCRVYGPPNACVLAKVGGADPAKVRPVSAGEQFSIGEVLVEVFPGVHGPTPLDVLLNRPLPGRLRSPLRLTDYRLDACLAYRLTMGQLVFTVGHADQPADGIFIYPLNEPADYLPMLKASRPRWVVPIHWDDFFRRLDQPLRPLFRPLNAGGRWLERLKMQEFCQQLSCFYPDAQIILLPKPFDSLVFSGQEARLNREHVPGDPRA